MQKLFFIISSLEDGGQERQLYNLLIQLSSYKNEFDLGLIVWNYSAKDKYASLIQKKGIKIFELKSGDRVVQKIINIRKIIKKYKPDIIQSFALYLNFPLYLSCLGTETIAIGGLRSGYKSGFRRSNLIVRTLAGFFPVYKISNNEKGAVELRALYESFFLDKNKIEVVRNKLDVVQFHISSFKRKTVNGVFKTVSIGTLSNVKRWDLVIRVISQIREMGFDVQHYHAGDGILREELKLLVQEKKLEEKFHFLGRIEDISGFLQDAYILLHTADSEGSSNVIMEAISSGVPVVCTRCGDIEYLVRDGITGLISEPGNLESLVMSTKELLDDPERVQNMSEAATNYAKTNFGINSYVSDLLNAYQKMGILE